MCPMNVTIVRAAGATTMVIIPIQMAGNSFILIPSDSLCTVMSGQAWTPRFYSPQIDFKEGSAPDSSAKKRGYTRTCPVPPVHLAVQVDGM